jgi:NAD+ synthase
VRAARADRGRGRAPISSFSELFICGLSARRPRAEARLSGGCRTACEALARETADGGPAVLVGTAVGRGPRSSTTPYALLDGGRIEAVRFKVDLPNYGVFDEKRVFAPGPLPGPIDFQGRAHRRAHLRGHLGRRRWSSACRDRRRNSDRAERLALLARQAGRAHRRRRRARHRSELPLIYLNQFGGQDELVFDGAPSPARRRSLAFQLPAFREASPRRSGSAVEGWTCARGAESRSSRRRRGRLRRLRAGPARLCREERLPGVVLGLSGGIDSALCAAMAVDALGAERVHCVMLPYRFTSESLKDARTAPGARRALRHPADRAAVEGLEAELRRCSRDRPRDITEENLQSRARGTILMSISNKFGPMVVTTGNKSEMSVGYATHLWRHERRLQPDQGSLQDAVSSASALRNRWKPDWIAKGPDGVVIPKTSSSSRRPPNCARTRRIRIRCRPTRFSTTFSSCWSRRRCASPTSSRAGYDLETVKKVERLLYIAEYKRRQSAPGVKVTRKNFGRDRRYPIVNRFRDPGGLSTRTARRPTPAPSSKPCRKSGARGWSSAPSMIFSRPTRRSRRGR